MADQITPAPGAQPDPTATPAPQGGAPAVPAPVGAAPATAKPNPFEDPIVAARIRSVRATVEKEARAKLLADLGVEDPDKWKAEQAERVKKLAEYEQKQQEQQRASMTEVEKLRADLASKDQRIAQLEAQLREREVDVQAARADVIVRETIHDHIDPTMQEDAQEALRRHVRALSQEQRKRFGKQEAADFFRKLAKDKPRYAKDAPGAPPPKPPPVKRPLSNGASPAAAAGKPATVVAAGPANGAKPKSKEDVATGWKKFGAPGRPY